ncbi:hypothetical protein D3C87_1803530 [compost metagenome]
MKKYDEALAAGTTLIALKEGELAAKKAAFANMGNKSSENNESSENSENNEESSNEETLEASANEEGEISEESEELDFIEDEEEAMEEELAFLGEAADIDGDDDIEGEGNATI